MGHPDRDHGLYGGEIIDDTAAHADGPYFAISVINDAVIDDTGSTSNITNLAGLSGITINAGTVLWGRWTQITLASGVVVAYKETT